MADQTGFDRYQRLYAAPPAVVVEWHDDQTPARGWLCIDSLRGGAAGGGTRLRRGGRREEAVFLAKTMAVKFTVAGPDIGGAKSVIDFDPEGWLAERLGRRPTVEQVLSLKRDVLRRWFRHVGPYLRTCYGTGGDVNVSEVDATRVLEEVVGVLHPQAGIARGHHWGDSEGPAPKIYRLRHGVEAAVQLPGLPPPAAGAWLVADVATGWGVAKALERYAHNRGESLAGKRATIEGFGAVGAFAAYYLARMGVRIVALSSKEPGEHVRVLTSPDGWDAAAIDDLIARREGADRTSLPMSGAGRSRSVLSESADEFYSARADYFVPCGPSHLLTIGRVRQLAEAGVTAACCGANNPFHADQRRGGLADWVSDMVAVQREADARFAIIPDFIANCGMARAFAYLMEASARPGAEAVLDDIAARVQGAVDRLTRGHDRPTGLLEHAYGVFLPRDPR